MTISTRLCPECSSEIKFSYIVPERSYIIENGKIVRDDAWTGPMYDGPEMDFYCSNDRTHNIETPSIVYEKDFYEWAEEIEDEFHKTVL